MYYIIVYIVRLLTVCVYQYSYITADMDYAIRSHEPRHPWPVYVRCRVGQVMEYKIYGYHGIIVGWDPICKVLWIVDICTYMYSRTSIIQTSNRYATSILKGVQINEFVRISESSDKIHYLAS